jgi:protein-L-isoaspartate O-methyltransferase
MDWKQHAEGLAGEVVHPTSRWRQPLATVPRHVFVPKWWAKAAGRWELRDGPADEDAWLRAAYSNHTLVTRVGGHHADHATTATLESGLPTSSSTLPGLVVLMYRHAMLADGSRVLVTTGTGFGTALACRRLGADLVTSVGRGRAPGEDGWRTPGIHRAAPADGRL